MATAVSIPRINLLFGFIVVFPSSFGFAHVRLRYDNPAGAVADILRWNRWRRDVRLLSPLYFLHCGIAH